jgi:hypothetical protein
MKTLHKIIIVIIVIFIVIGLYFLLRNRQNFVPQIKMSKKLKDRLLKLKQNEKKKSRIKDKNHALQKKIDEIQNKESYSGLFNLERNNKIIKEKYDPSFDEDYLRAKVAGSPLGYSYFLPNKNILKPSEFNQISGFNILKSYSVVKDKETDDLRKVDTISIDNTNGIKLPDSLENKLEGSINHYQTKEEIQSTITKSISGNVGGSYSGVSVQASFSYLTNDRTTSTFEYESNNIDFTKTTGVFGILQELFENPASYKTGFLLELYKLNNLNVREQEDYDKFKAFLERYGSHVVNSVKIGKKCSLWDTMQKDANDSTSIMNIKACVSVSYGGWVTCIPSNDYDPCGAGRFCAGYEKAKLNDQGMEKESEKKGTCQPDLEHGGQNVGVSIGGEVCGNYTDEQKRNAQSAKSISNMILEGGSPESQGAIFISKMNNTPVIDNTAVSEFLASSPNYDVPIELGFVPIWEVIRSAFYSDYKQDFINVYKKKSFSGEGMAGCAEVIKTNDIEICKKHCMNIEDCSGATFDPYYDNGSCWLKKGKGLILDSTDSNSFALIKSKYDTPMSILQKKVFLGEDIENIAPTDNKHICKQYCLDNPECSGATFNPTKDGGSCWLRKGKGSITDGKDDDYAIIKGNAFYDFPYNLNDINPGCKIIISDIDINKKFIDSIKNENKDFELTYPKTVIFTNIKCKKFLDAKGVKTKTIDNYTLFRLINQGETNYDSNYLSFNISKLIPKIILRDPEASENEDPSIESLLKEVTLILNISKDLKTAKLNYINPNNNVVFDIINISNIDSVKIINKVDYYSINLKLDIKVQTEDFDDRYLYNSTNDLILYYTNNMYKLEYKSFCNESDYISGSKSAKKCDKIETIDTITYYTFGYYDEELKINYLRLYVTDNDFSIDFDKDAITQICRNLEYVYGNAYVANNPITHNCLEVRDWKTGREEVGTIGDFDSPGIQFTCPGENDYITGIGVNWDENITDRLQFKCKSGELSGWLGGTDWGDWVLGAPVIDFPYGINGLRFSQDGRGYFWRGVKADGYADDLRRTLTTSSNIGGDDYHGLGGDYVKKVSCPPGHILKGIGIGGAYGSIHGMTGKCVPLEKCFEDNGQLCKNS